MVISLSRQRAFVYVGNRLAIDSPICSGKRTGMTPKGQFTILEKDLNHRSTIYGNFVDNLGRVVKAGVSTRIDSAPSGTHFVGAPMKRFLRMTLKGIGLHAGYLPGYPDSHGCIRLPADMATIIYNMVPLGTPVVVE
ncbi:MAG: hypothetical protein A3F67_04865 [Verrucomicrobia bacterium RIFCSPHIGHO2_12_FULL_41_10]|nr:MAG: hypothetical protein A3F67_04865 [Verrucomicrobia bacterium RIFCSPHIGHO2_12_FULL_41_10]